MKVTLSVIKADIGGYVGHSSSHPDILATAKESLEKAKTQGLLIDYHVTACGDDLQLIMTHQHGELNERVHKLAWDTLLKGTEVAKKLKLYGAGQDLLADAFYGNVKGMGPGVAEMAIEEGAFESIIIFMADKTAVGAWNLPLYKMFADPFNTIDLVIAPNMHAGFSFEVYDVKEHKKITFNTPEEIYDMLVFLDAPGRFAVKSIYSREPKEIAAVSSTERLSFIAGRYMGKDDPICIVRYQGNFPAVKEILDHFASSYMGCFNNPPRITGLDFQISQGKIVRPLDILGEASLAGDREQAHTGALHDPNVELFGSYPLLCYEKRGRRAYDVFLCHHSPDKPLVKEIGEQLQRRGLQPWLDEWELRPGIPWQQELEKKIQRIKSVAAFIGKAGIGPWQNLELAAFLRQFLRRGCPVIPVILPDCQKNPELPVFLEGMTLVDFRNPFPDPFDRLVWGITGIRPLAYV